MQIILNSFTESAVLMLVTLAVILIFKTSFTTNFAQGTISTMAAFFAAVIVNGKTADFVTQVFNPAFSIIIGMVVGCVAAFATSLLIDKLMLRKTKLKTPVGTQMITMGMVLILVGFISVALDLRGQYFLMPIIPGRVQFGGYTGVEYYMEKHGLLTIGISLFVIMTVFLLLRFTKWGLGVRATASNEIVADSMGVNTHSITAVTWGLAGAIGGLAAILYVPANNKADVAISVVSLMMMMQIDAFLSLVVGGVSNFYGPIIVAFFIPIVRSIIAVILSIPKTNFELESWKNAILYLIILLVILFLPNGIFGKKSQKKV